MDLKTRIKTALLLGLPLMWVLWRSGANPALERRDSGIPAKVVAIIPRGNAGAVLVTPGGALRFRAPESLESAADLAANIQPASAYDKMLVNRPQAPAEAEAAGCEHEPDPRGLLSRCPGGDKLMRFGGFPVTAVASYRGRIYVGTYGGGLRTLDAPDSVLGGFPSVIYALTPSAGFLLCGTSEGLVAFDGRLTRASRRRSPTL